MFSFLRENENSLRKRTILYRNILEKNPYQYHKKKNYYLSNNDPGVQNTNQELLFFQKENEKNMNLFHKFIKCKSQLIENNKINYLTFLANKGHKMSAINNNEANINHSQISISQSNDFHNSFNSENNSKEYSPNINIYSYHSPRYGKNKGSDITNPNYFDDIAKKLIIKRNKDILNYNYKAYKQKYDSSCQERNCFSFDKQLPLPPGRINNLKYYILGESRLKSNPIVSPGNRCISPFFNSNHNKRKSEFIM